MIIKKKFIITAVTVLGVAAVVGIYLLTSSQQKLLCHKTSCSNLDARHQQCDADAETIAEEKFTETTIKLRYSPKCDAAWAKAAVPTYSILYVEDAQGRKYGIYEVPNDEIPGEHYGNMGAGQNLKACVWLTDNRHLCTKIANQ
ncbi:DUF2690 domain-containing protein [Allocoleopsis sp.]|uniref:DUF2690 domain-containing protein n=1 Tax=Allocoleopsis sp. TaxID=3088169 RepID=UPI002FD4BEC2